MSLERIWAGWRSGYVRDVTVGVSARDDDSAAAGATAPEPEGSVFIQILASGRPDNETHVVQRGRDCFAILNRYPYTSGHLLVMPYREVAELEDLTADETTELWAMVNEAVRAIKAAYSPQGINIGVNLGEAAGAGVPTHVHVHVLPRWNADSNFMTAVAETRVLPESLDEAWEKLCAAWPRP